MDFQLTRVQVYLNPQDVAAIDRVAKSLRIKRSQIIRDATKSVAIRYQQVTEMLQAENTDKDALFSLIGFSKSRTGKAGLNVDEIYLQD